MVRHLQCLSHLPILSYKPGSDACIAKFLRFNTLRGIVVLGLEIITVGSRLTFDLILSFGSYVPGDGDLIGDNKY